VPGGSHASSRASWTLSVILPIVFIGLILGADLREGPKTAYVGVLAAVPFFAAIFGSPLMTAVTAVITWLSGFALGHLASDGNVQAQTVRLFIIAVAGMTAVGASYVRQRRDVQFQHAQRVAAEAEALRHQASRDDLTGLLNRRGVYERLEADDIRDGTVVVIDCDDFKVVNDTHGHMVGDEFLRGVAGRLAGTVSRDDLIARWGGDEFLILVRSPFVEGSEVAIRIVRDVSSGPVSTEAGLVPVSLSAGAAPLMSSDSFTQALAVADRAMYDAKSRGRGQIVLDPTSKEDGVSS
jgi:diguanylate cyclase (GGDEF)-like protein